MHVSRFVCVPSSVLSHACFLWHHEHLNLWANLHSILLLWLQWYSELLQLVDVVAVVPEIYTLTSLGTPLTDKLLVSIIQAVEWTA